MSSPLSLRAPYAIVGVIMLFGWVFLFCRSEYFDLKDVEIQTSGGIVSESDVLPIVFQILEAQSARPWSKRQLFFLPRKQLEEGIKTALYAEEVEVGDTDKNILRLKISFGSRFLYTTETGDTFTKCTAARPAGIPLEDPAVLSAAKKHYFASTDFTTQSIDGLVYVRKATSTLEVPVIKRLLELGKVLDQHHITFAHLEELPGQDVSIRLDRDREVLVDMSQPIKDQIERCQAILREKEYKDLKPIVIDLRIPGRAYIR